MNFKISGVFGAVALCVVASMGMAQTSTNQVASNTDWSVFAEETPTKECWAVSAPKETVNTKDGQTVAVNRGEILFMVFYRPSASINAQVYFTGGYPFASGSTATLDIGGTKFQMFTEGEAAWPATPEDDGKIVAAMKRGSEATITARSGRGTQTFDKFSLLGFTAAVEEAENRCK